MKLTETSIRNELDDLKDELASVKNTLESIKKNSRDYIIRYNSDLRIEFASDSLCNVLKIREKEIIGKGNIEIGIPASSANIWNKTMRTVLKTGRSRRVEFSLPYNGSDHFYEAVIVPEKGEKSNYRNILCIVRDTTSKKKSEHQHKHLLKELETQKKELEKLLSRDKILLNNLNEGVIISDAQGKLLYMNESSKCFHDIFNETDLKSYKEELNSKYEFYKNGTRLPFNDLPLQRPLRNETFSDFEIRILNSHTGKSWYSNFSGSPVMDDQGNFVFSVLSISDVTEKKNSESDLNLAQSVAHIGSWRLNIIKNELTWSDEAYRIFNIPAGTPLTYEMFLSFVHPEDRQTVDIHWKAALLGDKYDIEHRIIVNGTIKWVRETAILELDGEGKLKGGFGTVQDITKQKEAAQQLMMSEQKLTWALQAGKGGVWDWEHATNTVWLSEEIYKLYGIEAGTHFDFNYMLNILDDRDKERVLRVLGDSISNRTDIHCDMRIYHPEKGTRWIEFHGTTFYDHSGIAVRSLGIALDITERKKNEEVLIKYAESLKFLSGTATNMIEKLGSPELFRFISDSLYKVAGGDIIIFSEFDVLQHRLVVKEFRCTTEEKEKTIKILGREPEGLAFDFPDEIRGRIKPGGLDILEGGIFELVFGQLPQTFCKDLEYELGIRSVFAMACTVDRDILGTVAVLSHVHSDQLKDRQVIESVVNQAALALKRKRVEDELRISEEKFATAFKSNPNGLVLSNMEDGTIYEINDTFLEITGRKKEDVIGKSSLDLDIFLNPDDRTNAVNLLREKGSLRNFEIRIKHSSGNERIILLSIDIFTLAGRKTMLTNMQDITLQKQAELKISEQAAFITGITEAVPDMISVIELPSMNLLYTNREPFSMQGFDSDRMKKMSAEDRNNLIHPDDSKSLADYFNKILVLQNRDDTMVEYRARNFQDHWMWFRARGRVFERYADGSVKSCINIIQNITEQKIAEEKLRKSEERFRSLITASSDAIYRMSSNWSEMLLLNGAGFLTDTYEVSNDWLVKYIHPEDHAEVLRVINKAIEDKHIFELEHRVRMADGSWGWTFSRAVPILDSNGDIIEWFGAASDFTSRREMEVKLRESEQRFRGIFYNAAIGIVETDNNNMFINVNDRICEMTGYSQDELLTKNILDLTATEDLERTKIMVEKLHRGEINTYNYEKQFIKKDGNKLWTNVTVSAVRDSRGNFLQGIGTVDDISGRKKTEEKLLKALTEAEEGRNILNALMENIPMGITIADAPDVNIRMVSKYGQDLLEKPSSEIGGIVAPEHPSKWGVYHADGITPGTPEQLPLTRATVNGEVIKNEEWIVTHKDGKLIPILCNAAPIRDKEGKITGGVIGWQDISEIRKNRQQLMTQAMILEQVHDAIFAADNANTITYINKAAIKQYEIKDPEKIIGSKLGESFSLEWMNEEQQHESTISLKKKSVWKGENFYTTAKGKMFWADSVISVTMDESGCRNGWVAIVRDISERKLMEDQLRKKNDHLIRVNELLEDFVHIAAHDLRGPIANMIMLSDFITVQESAEKKDSAFSQLRPIVKKLQHTVDGLLETVIIQKDSNISFKKIYFKDLYNDVIDNCDNEPNRYRVKIETDFSSAPEIDYVEAFIYSIMKNLISNSMKYSSDIENPFIHISTKRENQFVLLIIRDNGIGIDLEKDGENLFKPFKRFTSKAEGTGMGLYIIKNIIEKNGGHIVVKSNLNEGTSFYCFLKEYTIGM